MKNKFMEMLKRVNLMKKSRKITMHLFIKMLKKWNTRTQTMFMVKFKIKLGQKKRPNIKMP